MIEIMQTKKKLMIGVIAGVLTVGGAGYYYTTQYKKPAPVNSNSHQTNVPVMAMGDVVTLDAKARQLSGLQTAKAENLDFINSRAVLGKFILS